MKVAITNAAGAEFPGFGFRACDRVETDSTAHRVTWKGNGDISKLAGKTVRLKFESRDTKLYAFEFKE